MIRKTALLLALLVVTPALAGPREDVYSASQRCAAITDDHAWLDCYYGAAQPMRGQLQLSPAPASQIALVPPPGTPIIAMAQAPRPAAPPKDGPVSRTLAYLGGGGEVLSKVAIQSYDAGRQGGFTVTLANGQVWKQNDQQPRFTRWHDGAAAHHVTIWKGALNSFNLGFDEETDKYKVVRIK